VIRFRANPLSATKRTTNQSETAVQVAIRDPKASLPSVANRSPRCPFVESEVAKCDLQFEYAIAIDSYWNAAAYSGGLWV
jgi:hypothetical protein